MKKRVGVVLRPEIIKSGKEVYSLLDSFRKIIISYDCIPIPLAPNVYDPHKVLNDIQKKELIAEVKNLDGLILQGGDDFFDYDKVIAKYFIDNDIPVLGICLGAELLASLNYYNIELIDLKNHNNHKFSNFNSTHDIILNKNSFLYQIIKKEKIKVNSFHKSAIKNIDNFIVSAYSTDNIIEAIEFKNKKFALGVQWHPEKAPFEVNNKKIFDKFFNTIKKG